MINIAIVGAAGRMGKTITRIVYSDIDTDIVAAIDRKESVEFGEPIYEAVGVGKGGVKISDDILTECSKADVIIDFTGCNITMSNLPLFDKLKKPLVIGSTGFTDEDKTKILNSSKTYPILRAPNFSLGLNVALKLINLAASMLDNYDIELLDIHHRLKKDAPSGTALAMAAAAATGAGIDLKTNVVHCREGLIGERKDNEIGIQTLRGGDVVGDHTVYFFGNNERLEITHRAHSRDAFANGAVKVAKWIVGKPAKLYNMNDFLEL